MIVVLCHPDDDAALWLHAALRDLVSTAIELVSVEQVAFSRRIVHRMDGAGDAGAIHIGDRMILRPERITGLINRLRHVPTQHFALANPDDQAYATAELTAFLLAWINGVAGRVINPPLPLAPGGGSFALTTMLHHAAVAGLSIGPWRTSSNEDPGEAMLRPITTHAAIVLDDQLFGQPLPPELADGCRRFAALLGVPLLQVLLHNSSENGWRFVSATGAVDFRMGGRALAAGIASGLGVEPTA